MSTVADEVKKPEPEPEQPEVIADVPRTLYGLWNEYQYNDTIHKVILIGKEMTETDSRYIAAERWRSAAKLGRKFILQFDTFKGTVTVQDTTIQYMIFFVKNGAEIYFRRGKKWKMIVGKGAMIKAFGTAFPEFKKGAEQPIKTETTEVATTEVAKTETTETIPLADEPPQKPWQPDYIYCGA